MSAALVEGTVPTSAAVEEWRAKVEEMKRRRRDGESVRDIARAMGLSKSRVGRELRDFNERPADRGTFPPGSDAPPIVPRPRDVLPSTGQPGALFVGDRVVLDLCGGSGAWSAPYRAAGYDVRLITWPEHDVRLYVPPANVWGILAAPPCTVFSVANGHVPPAERDWVKGMECVNACLRIILQGRPRWWGLENPAPGYLSRFLGPPAWTFQHRDFGDPGFKNTGIWGEFIRPPKRTRVEAVRAIEYINGRDRAARRAVTPPGFASAFFEVNP
jgi:hypothetical protein